MSQINVFNKKKDQTAYIHGGNPEVPHASWCAEDDNVYLNETGTRIVDLGLPSGMMWADCNVGAVHDYDTGIYFAWGEEVSRESRYRIDMPYDWAHYAYNNGRDEFDTQYFNTYIKEYICPQGTLLSACDAATLMMGGLGSGWRMPTQEEFQELIDNTDHEYVPNYKESGVNGMIFANKSDSSKYIFLPYAGVGMGNNIEYINEGGYYFTSTIRLIGNPTPMGLYSDGDGLRVQYGIMYCGTPIRPIFDRAFSRRLPFPYAPVEIAYYDGSKIDFTYEADVATAEGCTPIGVTVIPASHTLDGCRRIMALSEINENGEMEEMAAIIWSTVNDDTGIARRSWGGNIIDVNNIYNQHGASLDVIPCPYNTDGSKNPYYSNNGRYATNDFAGKYKTACLVERGEEYVAAKLCHGFSTVGTQTGDWYLPAAGEMGYVWANHRNINKALASLNGAGGASILQDVPGIGGYCFTSTEFSEDLIDSVGISDGFIPVRNKDWGAIVRPFTTVPVTQCYEMVDLGLPSGLKWAKCNIGAARITDYGDYFMFGSTTPDTNNVCDWAHAPFNNGASIYDATYFTAHKSEWFNGDVLKPQYDAATVNMGEGWRMPTDDDFQELISGTNNEWTTINGIKGYKFTNKTDSSKYIFIPASGYRDGSDVTRIGDRGNVWCSSLYSIDFSRAWQLDLDFRNIYILGSNRYLGHSVRGVFQGFGR